MKHKLDYYFFLKKDCVFEEIAELYWRTSACAKNTNLFMRSKPRKERKRVKKWQFFFFSSRDTTNRNRTSEHSMLISPFYHKQIKSKVFSFRNVRTIDFERKLKPMIQTKQFQPRCCIAFSLFVGFRGTSCCFSFFVHFFWPYETASLREIWTLIV